MALTYKQRKSLKGYKRVKKTNNDFREIKYWQKVVVAMLWPAEKTVMFTVDKYAKGWGKTYKSYEACIKDDRGVLYWR